MTLQAEYHHKNQVISLSGKHLNSTPAEGVSLLLRVAIIMSKLWANSLLFRLMLIVGCIIALFGIVTESVQFWSRYVDRQTTLRHELVAEVGGLVNEQSNHYFQAQYRLNTFHEVWRALPEGISLNLNARDVLFIPFTDERIQTDNPQLYKAMQAVKLFGNAGNSEAIYLILPHQGMIIYHPDSADKHLLQQRAAELLALSQQHSRTGIVWGTPFSIGDRLYVPMTQHLSDSEAISGINLAVWSKPELNPDLNDNIAFAMLDGNNQLLPLSSQEKAIPADEFPVEILSRCQSNTTMLYQGFNYVCKALKEPGWQLVARYPQQQIVLRALESQLWTLPPVAAVWLTLLAIIYWVLLHQVIRPLRRFVDVVDRFRFMDWAHSLTEGRNDELGRIARAYNRLLVVIRAHYETLEKRVHERTRALDDARRSAEQLSSSKSIHMASISHEIRTPMNGVVGALSLLQRSRLTAEQQDLVETAHTSADYLLSIINNLLDYNHIEAGQLQLSYEPTELLPLLDRVMMTVCVSANAKGLKLSCLVAANLPESLEISRIRVKQILINMLGNAIKFTEQGDVRLQVERQGHLLMISVEDSGKGILPEHLQTIFRPFVQISEHSGGNGLGLTISAMLAQLMGGEIKVTSQPGKGSCFTLLLPINHPGANLESFSGTLSAPAELHQQLQLWGITPQQGEQPLLSSPTLVYLPGRLQRQLAAIYGKVYEEDVSATLPICPWSLKVLVVDDITTNREIVSKILRALGHQPDSVASGAQALEAGRLNVYDMVLMDLRMPEMDGFETAQRWRDPLSGVLDDDTPIIALTANTLSVERERVKKSVMNGYLAKPLRMEKLLQAIEHVVVMQMAREIELMPNELLQRPLFDATQDAEMQNKLRTTLQVFAQRIDESWQQQQQHTLLELLHALKGCAGLAGIDDIFNASEQLETEVRHGNWPTAQQIRTLLNRLSAASGSTVTSDSDNAKPN